MPRLNVYGLETLRGYRTFEIHADDLSALDIRVDVLVLSAFKHSYVPTPGSVIGALHERLGVDVDALSRDPELDLRAPLGCWVSRPGVSDRIGRILAIELRGAGRPLREAFENVFATLSVLEAKGAGAAVVALPLLGAGQQFFDPDRVVRTLLEAAPGYLRRSDSTEKILFVEVVPERAQRLAHAMDDTLGRISVSLPEGALADTVRQEVLALIDTALGLKDAGLVLNDLRHVVSKPGSRSFEVGVAGRKLAERIVRDLSGGGGGSVLWKDIDQLAGLGVSDWVRSYLHLLRIIGNEGAHDRTAERRRPETLSEKDVALALFCIHRVLDFWIETHRRPLG